MVAFFGPSNLHAVHAGVALPGLRVLADVQVPGSDIPAGVMFAPLRNRKLKKVEHDGRNHVFQHWSGPDHLRRDWLAQPLPRLRDHPRVRRSWFKPECQADTGRVREPVRKNVLPRVAFDVLEQQRLAPGSGPAADAKFPVDPLLDSEQAPRVFEHLDEGAQIEGPVGLRRSQRIEFSETPFWRTVRQGAARRSPVGSGFPGLRLAWLLLAFPEKLFHRTLASASSRTSASTCPYPDPVFRSSTSAGSLREIRDDQVSTGTFH